MGAGASGIMSAIFSKNENTEVFLFDGNEKIGKKIYISGKGRCNITNSKEIYEFFDEINRNKNFLYSSLYSYTNEDILKFFNENGLKTKVERGGRVFPLSDKSSDVIKTLENVLNIKGVKTILNTEIKDVKLVEDKFELVCNKDYGLFDKVIFATGGKSYPFTGSRGRGHEILKNLGHTITDLKSGLVGIDVKEKIRKYSGVSLKFVDFKIYNSNRKLINSEFGEMLFTHTGFSGPIVLKSSKYFDNSKDFIVSIDLKPKLDEHTLDLRLLREFDENKNKNLKNVMVELVLEKSEVDGELSVNQLKKEDRKKLVETIKNLEFNFKSLRPLSEAIITIGGVSVKEVNSSTMESKLIKNLYIVGELLDVDANTGGYNLTIAFSTGHLAGVSCIEKGE
ncbi:NAD(P)/FAD-dependent oxidoreductase [uncultured Parvimonas sp.]|uniref:NAD(P)/FAD-dependent oxidoreductase n=1 Tax=uncultured Parvimonas sp. TaxID=747372 RepID=UPI0028891D15|nr:NAD(P)/FAD-dependent oxidoreductase [uncultured Parvimonas sp.]